MDTSTIIYIVIGIIVFFGTIVVTSYLDDDALDDGWGFGAIAFGVFWPVLLFVFCVAMLFIAPAMLGKGLRNLK
jgi:H+/Cl- antiporter ClcA